MKKIIFSIIGLSLGIGAYADITVKVPVEKNWSNIRVRQASIKDMSHNRGNNLSMEELLVPVVNGQAIVKSMSDEPAVYYISGPDPKSSVTMIYASPDDNLTAEATDYPIFNVSGTPLMEGATEIMYATIDKVMQIQKEKESVAPDQQKIKELLDDVNQIPLDFIAKNPDSPAAAWALMSLNDEDFLNAYSSLTPAARKSIVMPLVEVAKKKWDKKVEVQKRLKMIDTGTVDAPDFALKNPEGKEIALSDFRGKWVIIDFWGSWCRWCIKGFPTLKEAYAKYKPELEIIGIDCNEPKEAWLAAIEKYNLDWVNLYYPSDDGGDLLMEYNITGYPSKAIVDPSGKLRNITVGDDPAFYTTLESLIKTN